MPRIGLSCWSLKWASSLLSLLPINPGLGSWQPPTCSGRTQWPHTKFIAYNIAVGGDRKYFCGVFRLGIPRGCWQWHILIHYPPPCSEAYRRRGMVCSMSVQSSRDWCCPRCSGKEQVTCVWCTLILAVSPQSNPSASGQCCSLFTVKTLLPWLVALLGSLFHHLKPSLGASANKYIDTMNTIQITT